MRVWVPVALLRVFVLVSLSFVVPRVELPLWLVSFVPSRVRVSLSLVVPRVEWPLRLVSSVAAALASSSSSS